MHINRNILAEYQKIKKLKKIEERSTAVRIYGKSQQNPIYNC